MQGVSARYIRIDVHTTFTIASLVILSHSGGRQKEGRMCRPMTPDRLRQREWLRFWNVLGFSGSPC
jgi:hypothetical protein